LVGNNTECCGLKSQMTDKLSSAQTVVAADPIYINAFDLSAQRMFLSACYEPNIRAGKREDR
jgi:hypothetical protein